MGGGLYPLFSVWRRLPCNRFRNIQFFNLKWFLKFYNGSRMGAGHCSVWIVLCVNRPVRSARSASYVRKLCYPTITICQVINVKVTLGKVMMQRSALNASSFMWLVALLLSLSHINNCVRREIVSPCGSVICLVTICVVIQSFWYWPGAYKAIFLGIEFYIVTL